MFVLVVLLLHGHVWGSIEYISYEFVPASPAVSCMSGSSNLNRFRDRGQVAVELVSFGVLPPGLVQFLVNPLDSTHCPYRSDDYKFWLLGQHWYVHILVSKENIDFQFIFTSSVWSISCLSYWWNGWQVANHLLWFSLVMLPERLK